MLGLSSIQPALVVLTDPGWPTALKHVILDKKTVLFHILLGVQVKLTVVKVPWQIELLTNSAKKGLGFVSSMKLTFWLVVGLRSMRS